MKAKRYILPIIAIIVIALAYTTFRTTTENKIGRFYEMNKDNQDILIFGNVFISLIRDAQEINLMDCGKGRILVQEYDKSTGRILKIRASDSAFKKIEKECDISEEEAMARLTRLMSIYTKLDVLAVYGFEEHIIFVVTHEDAIVFIPDRSLLTDYGEKLVSELEVKTTRIFDDHWFAYKLDKPYEED